MSLLTKPPPHSCATRNSDSSCQGTPSTPGPGMERQCPRWEPQGLKHPLSEDKRGYVHTAPQAPFLPGCPSPAAQASRRPGPDISGFRPMIQAHPALAGKPPPGDSHHQGCRGTNIFSGLLAWGRTPFPLGSHVAHGRRQRPERRTGLPGQSYETPEGLQAHLALSPPTGQAAPGLRYRDIHCTQVTGPVFRPMRGRRHLALGELPQHIGQQHQNSAPGGPLPPFPRPGPLS